MTEAINLSRNAKQDWVSLANSVQLTARRRAELLIELAAKKRTIVQGGLFMLDHKKLKFDDFDRALQLLNRAKTPYDLGAVETALQTQIDVILRMADNVDLTIEEKSLCLYALQNMIFGLSDYQLPNERENDFVPKILQDHAQVILKGTSKGMDWNELNDYCYTEKYQDLNNPVLAQFKFLDFNRIKELDKIVAQNHTVAVRQEKHNTIQSNAGVITWGILEFEKTAHVDVNKILNQALARFDTIDLKNHPENLFNFVKDSVEAQNKNPEVVNYQILHEIAVAAMHRIVEIGRGLQRQNFSAQQTNDGRSI